MGWITARVGYYLADRFADRSGYRFRDSPPAGGTSRHGVRCAQTETGDPLNRPRPTAGKRNGRLARSADTTTSPEAEQ